MDLPVEGDDVEGEPREPVREVFLHHFLERLGDLLSELGREVPGLRWATPGSLHVTLKFLGEVEEPRISPLCDALRRSTEMIAAFDELAENLRTRAAR